MNMKNIHNTYLEDGEQNARPNAELRDKLAKELFAKPEKKSRWAFFAMPALGMATIAIALVVVMRPEAQRQVAFREIDEFSDSTGLAEEKSWIVDLLDGGGAHDDEATSGGYLAPHREIKNFECVDGCENLIIFESSRAESVLYNSGDCETCNEVMLTANYGSNGDIHLGGYAILAGNQRHVTGQTVEASRFGETFTVSIPGWSDSGWDYENPVKTFYVTLTETGEWNLVDDITCEGGCDGFNVITDRAGAYTVIHEGCPPDPCRTLALYQAAEYGSGAYSVSLGRPMGTLDQDVAWEVYEQSISTDELEANSTIHIRASAEGVTCEFDIVE